MTATRDEVPPDTSLPGVDPLGDPFLRTRFTLPGRPVTFLRRARLDEHLDQALLTPLTLVNGCAGAGKTLLVADWAERLDRPVAWLTLDAAVEGPGTFWAHLLQSLNAAGVPIPAAIGFPADATRVPHTLLSRLASELAARDSPLTVVIDEYDQMTDPEVARQLDFVLQHARPGLRLVLVTRTEPLLPLHRYRVAGEMTEIRDAELAFTPEEAATLLGLHGLPLDVPGARPLVERTRGWAAGLRLCALAARASPDPERYLKEFEAGRSAIADFLLAEVLERQTPETQDLLLRISVLDRFRPELADALTERTDAADILAELHRANAFVEDFGHGWYRLHPLFREILRAHLRRRAPGLEPRLHRRAAHWLRRSGALPEMLAHGAAAQDWTYVARALVEDLAIGQLFTGLGTEVPPEWFAGLEAETHDPAAHLVRAARALSRSDLGQGLVHLRRAEERLAADDGGSRAAQLSLALLEALAGRLSGSAHRTERAARSARRLMPQLPARLLDGHPELGALLLTHVGSSRLWAGRFDEARAALTTVTRGPRSAATVLPRMGALEHLALVDHLHGWPSAAERRVHEMTAEAERYGAPQPSGSGLGRLVLAAVALDRDEVDRAEALLAETAHEQPPDPVSAAARRFVTAGVLLARGRTRAALAVAAQDVPAADHSPWAQGRAALVASAAHLAEGDPDAAGEVLRRVAGDQPLCTVGAARALLAAGDPGAALRLLDGPADHPMTGPGVAVPTLLVRARAAELEGDAATARGLLAQALQEGRGEELRRPFRDAGPWIVPFLAEPPLRSLAAGWLVPDPVSASGERPRPDPVPAYAERTRGGTAPGPLVEQLSPREREVLERLARTMSTEDIAADLYVSVNTVKTHLKSAYRKLSVHRRNDAVRRARELGLL
ncbi:LuxR C-terminal-related transcriptional regulator [Streptomyces sp. NPDC093089]|uniref:LuxR C-terminal-related transcriptional regulator n=1 Tax=Streptomyces sp. NPDC093089 TaxID=3366024 RepID=UPI00382D89CA